MCELYEEAQEAKRSMIYDQESNTLEFTKRRTTDLKNNARVYFPKSKSFQEEAKFEFLRIEAIGLFRNNVAEKCIKGGDNLVTSLSQKRGG